MLVWDSGSTTATPSAPIRPSADEPRPRPTRVSRSAADWRRSGNPGQAYPGRQTVRDSGTTSVNDACGARFSPLEAVRAKALLGLPEAGGREALACALAQRLYAAINERVVFVDRDGSLILQMMKCRVQAARQRKGLPDYPSKSGGVVEYTSFARTIDPRIGRECIACPPDPHPAEWFCAWRFRLAPAAEEMAR